MKKAVLYIFVLTRMDVIGGLLMLLALAAVVYDHYRVKRRYTHLLLLQKQDIDHKDLKLQELNAAQNKLLNENEWLLKEIHHRVKNNLQIAMSLLNTQSFYLENEKALALVEDELVVANDIRLTLERAGYTVFGVARSFHSAMDMISLNPPRLVILDIFLKGELTGIDLAAQLNKKDIRFVYLSANCNAGVLEMAKITQPSGFIVKPFREKDLLVTLDIARYRHNIKKQMATVAADQVTTDRRQKSATPRDQEPAAVIGGHTEEGLNGIIGKSAGMQKSSVW